MKTPFFETLRRSCALLVLMTVVNCCNFSSSDPLNFKTSSNDLHFTELPTVWDEGIPLGNGMVGALIWEKEGKLRLSLDRADLWDLRPMENLKIPEWKYSWVYEQWKKDDYRPVQEKFDVPYDRSPAPSKIPAAALEFDISSLGDIASVRLHLKEAICEVKWKNGTKLLVFVHATEPVGWYRFEGLEKPLPYELIPPAYNLKGQSGAESPVTGQDLRRLEYPEGSVVKEPGSITYSQEGWGDFRYQVNVSESDSDDMEGCWSISSEFPGWEKKASAKEVVENTMRTGIDKALGSHRNWWHSFWSQSSIQVPDTILQRQWHLEMYKFGAAARVGAPPISLQAVWTADNGKLPPWKGDFHHDLNTQLSYWPAYSANHLEQETGFINWLWKYRDSFKKYTKAYYEAEGLAVPGVTTLTGEPMGGWIQYAFGPTVSGWLSQHFYLHWRYSMDREFLKKKVYPWIKEVAVFFEDISIKDAKGYRKLPISASPETHDNSREAWFGETTNFDLAAIRWTYEKAEELALELGNKEDVKRWKNSLTEWPYFAIDDKEGLMLAPGHPYGISHRHFSHLLAFHPLGLIDYSKGDDHKIVIDNTINNLVDKGSDWWTGYSFSWLGNLKARAFDGEGAAEALRIFATSFCLLNGFHVNGDQSGKGYSNFKYRPFTLEGNFAFAAGLQEMLIQSHTGIVRIFPAVPSGWSDISFDQLRTQGAFLVTAEKENGVVTNVEIKSLQGGILKLKNPFETNALKCSHNYRIDDQDIIDITTEPGDIVRIKIENR